MSFASPLFLWYFLPAVLAAVVVAPRHWRNGIVAIASLAFYAVGAGPTTLLLLACMVVHYVLGPALEPDDWDLESKRRRRLLVGVIAFDVAVLAIWKYAGFASAQAAGLASFTGLDLPTVSLALPIGISFYTFHHISYVVDIYRGERPALRNMASFVAYIALFPQLIAGPIVRYREMADQLSQARSHRLDDIAAGFPRFALGLIKKVVIADSLAPVVDTCFATPTDQLTTATAWLGAIAYTLQLYFDFSGYSDMAIGLGRMLGFKLPENFARPYSSASVTEFWRRWHMSLSRWFRDYVYIPLGGNRCGVGTAYRNLWIVFALVGLWHGANWTFLFWGLYHGTVLVIERRRGWGVAATEPQRRLARRALTLLIVVIGWVPLAEPKHRAGPLAAHGDPGSRWADRRGERLLTASQPGPPGESIAWWLTCPDSAQRLSAIVKSRRRLTAWRRHDLEDGREHAYRFGRLRPMRRQFLDLWVGPGYGAAF
jgi:alginate O-acetyltransferase complex protein AlgI